MAKTVQIVVPAHQTDELIAEVHRVEGLIGLRVQRGVSLHPPGDVLAVDVTNRALHRLIRLLSGRGIGQQPSGSLATSEPTSIVSAPSREAIARDTSEASWEEMEVVMGKESNMTINTLILMGICGLLATIGIATNALHVVVAAMLIAPGFEPITRFGLGIIARSSAWRRGLADTLKGYAILVLAAAVTTLVLRWTGTKPLGGEASYLPAGVLISYWTTLTLSSLLVTAAASVAGALLIATNRSVLTGGVMIGLALVPSAAITGMGLTVGDWEICGRALLRWLIEVSCVGVFSLVVFAWKQQRVHRRRMLL